MAITSNPTASKTATPKTLNAAKPGTKDATAKAAGKGKGKKEKVARVDYPGLFDSEGNAVKLNEWPADYNPKAHKPFKKSNFADESVFMLAKAERLEAMAAKLRKEAETVKSLGTTAQRQSARKLLKMQEGMAALMKSLAEQGVDVASLMAAAQATTKPAEAPAPQA